MPHFRKIEGERLYLSPMDPDDAPVYAKWLNDPAVADTLGAYAEVCSPASERKMMEELGADGHCYAIVLKESGALIGSIGLFRMDKIHRLATLVMFIGEAEMRGRGYGAEAAGLMLDYGFDALNLHNVMLTVFGDNPRGLACYRKAGFKEIGLRREARIRAGRFIDVMHMDILEGERRELRARQARG